MNLEALEAALAAMGNVPPRTRIPTMDEMTRRTRDLAAAYPDLVEVSKVGHSRSGEAIEMISVGNGPKSALLVGAPHPNEPIGCMTIEYLLDRLCQSADFRQALPYRWHCIKAIEPDALRLNEGWFDRPGDVEHYLRNFFRPATADQAEYGFPFDETLAITVSTTPENDAWRAAFDLSKPDFLYSLHNADHGGSFYILSRPDPELASILSRQTARLGLGLNVTGEPLSDSPSLGEGVFAPFDAVRWATAPGGGWPAGDTSANYAERHGAFELIAEVSYWEDALPAPSTAPPRSRNALIEDRNRWYADIARLGQPVLGRALLSGDVAYDLVYRSARETFDRAQPTTIAPENERQLSEAAFRSQWIALRLIVLRKVGLLRRLAILNGQPDNVRACSEYITEGAKELLSVFPFRISPLNALITAQLHACVATAARLAA